VLISNFHVNTRNLLQIYDIRIQTKHTTHMRLHERLRYTYFFYLRATESSTTKLIEYQTLQILIRTEQILELPTTLLSKLQITACRHTLERVQDFGTQPQMVVMAHLLAHIYSCAS
jgi:hypothetical protein